MDSITISLRTLNTLLQYADPGERYLRALNQAFDGQEITITPTLADQIRTSLETIKREEAVNQFRGSSGRQDPAYPPMPRLPDVPRILAWVAGGEQPG